VKVAAAALAEIKAHGAQAYPLEACGFVFGRLGEGGEALGLKAFRARNAGEPEKLRRRFRIEPEEFLAAELAAREAGLDLLGIYHSHPDHPAEPSAHDLALALPFYRYLIVAVQGGEPKEISAWLLAPDRSRFLAEELAIIGD
jgi:proteasome lid subunit RPN8/RPN11